MCEHGGAGQKTKRINSKTNISTHELMVFKCPDSLCVSKEQKTLNPGSLPCHGKRRESLGSRLRKR